MKVIIVGAGTAGLAALHALHGAGVEGVTLEKEGAAGGRSRASGEAVMPSTWGRSSSSVRARR
ncbi:MAG: NAD(P)-binding protein [Actinobacteria bacterium]|nr:NAD(P)-binding protein [Actinomycetota bacterium]